MKKQISRTKIKSNLARKTNPAMIELIRAAKKHAGWLAISRMLSGPSQNYQTLNLSEIDKHAKEGDTIVVLGKVLSSGDVSKKLRICALGISSSAREKLKKTKSEFVTLAEEIKINPKAEGIKLIR
jgi:large subunit ribosomal protein L18e